jgi:hypothetical protein
MPDLEAAGDNLLWRRRVGTYFLESGKDAGVQPVARESNPSTVREGS